jgi:hypothetical protein
LKVKLFSLFGFGTCFGKQFFQLPFCTCWDLLPKCPRSQTYGLSLRSTPSLIWPSHGCIGTWFWWMAGL